MIASIEREPVGLCSPGLARAMLRGESQSRSFADRLRALHRNSEIEKRHAGLGIGISLGLNSQQYSSGAAALKFSTLFPGSFVVLQSDLGLTYGGTTLGTGTTPPVGGLTGTLVTRPVPIMFKCTTAGTVGAGAVFAAYVDGVGTTPFMTGIAPAAGTPVALTGSCAGLSHAWAAGTAALDNVWQATCSALADQSGNNKHALQAAAAKQPIVGLGKNGRVSLIFSRARQTSLYIVGMGIGTPAVQGPTTHYIVGRGTAVAAAQSDFMGHFGYQFFTQIGTNLVADSIGGSCSIGGLTINAWYRYAMCWTNSAADRLQVGSIVNSTFAGTTFGAPDYAIGGAANSGTVANHSDFEFFSVSWFPGTTSNYATPDAAINSPAGYGVGAIGV